MGRQAMCHSLLFFASQNMHPLGYARFHGEGMTSSVSLYPPYRRFTVFL
jgi:hypothetical protein